MRQEGENTTSSKRGKSCWSGLINCCGLFGGQKTPPRLQRRVELDINSGSDDETVEKENISINDVDYKKAGEFPINKFKTIVHETPEKNFEYTMSYLINLGEPSGFTSFHCEHSQYAGNSRLRKGYKFHILVHQADIPQAWDIVKKTLIQHEVVDFKIIRSNLNSG